jgi:LysR family transcriptional regulator, regulator for genes of the gallate degradation pathway
LDDDTGHGGILSCDNARQVGQAVRTDKFKLCPGHKPVLIDHAMDFWAFNLRHLRAVSEIRHLGSISAAGSVINLTQPAITQALAKLEGLLGLALFERSPEGMQPTAAAVLLTPRIDAALAHIASSRVTMAQVRALIAFADGGSYSVASAMTGVSQPSLHRAVGDLGIALRKVLLERRGKGLMLTEAGRKIVRSFRLARAELAAGLSELENLKGHETGRIAIGAMPLSRARLLPAAVAAFNRLHPEVEIVIAEGSLAELIEPLRDGALDLMIGALREPSPGKDIQQQPLFTDRPVVIARKGHPLRNPDAAALARYPWIVSAPGTPLHNEWHRMFAAAGLDPPRVPIECGSVMTIRQILMETDFLTLLSPDQVAVELEAGWLVKVCDAPGNLQRTIGVTTRSGWKPTKLQQVLLDELVSASP